MEQMLVRNRTRGTIVAASAGLATSWWARLRGLMGRQSLLPGEGLIIRPCSSIHTCFMAFPIEVLFVGAEERVLRAAPAIPPWRIGPLVPRTRYVVELPAGAIAASRTADGDELELVEVQASSAEGRPGE